VKILMVGDYPDDARLGSTKVYHKLRGEFGALGHGCHLLLAPQLGPRPAAPRLRWAAGPWIAAAAIRKAICEHGPFDVVDAASAEGLGFGVARRAGAHAGTALVARSHGLEQRNYAQMLEDARAGLASKPLHRRLWYPAARLSQVALAARVADRLIVLNDADRDFAVGHGWKTVDRMDVIPHGVSTAFLAGAPEADAPRGDGILFCGSWAAVKGVSYLVDAFTRIHAARRAARLTVLGPGVAAADVLAAFPAGVRGAVRVVPRAPEDEVMRAYRTHDLLVVSSVFEGFGMVLVEAMSQGLPPVSTPVGCAPAVVREGRTGLLVPARDAGAMADAVVRLLDDSALRRRLGAAAREAVRGMTWTAAARRTVAAYEAAIEHARR
jgi:glycosyltransferase involved in cell wall biosynthesis